MRVTVRELNADAEHLGRAWERLVAHARAEQSELVLLPEMPFCPWFGVTLVFEERVWRSAVAAHDAWAARLAEPAQPPCSAPAGSSGTACA